MVKNKVELLDKQAIRDIITQYVNENELSAGDTVTFQIEDFRVLVFQRRTRE